MTRLTSVTAALVLALAARGAAAQEAHIQTALGEIDIALDAAHAPQSVANFIRYAKEGHFDGTVIYRVVPGFVIQMGSFDAHGNEKPAHEPIPLESGNGLSNLRGTVAMARSDDPKSATAEFFINLADNSALDPKPGRDPNTTGYAVFGRVVEGMSVVAKIASLPNGGTGPMGPEASPAVPVVITKVTIVP